MLKPIREVLDELSIPEPMSGCHLWIGTVQADGYGWVREDSQSRRQRLAHRVAWKAYRGPIPDGLCVLHKCDTPACINPDHLFLGTRNDNYQDCKRKNRTVRGEMLSKRLRDADIIRIRSDGRKNDIIAGEYRVSRSLISMIKSRKRWAHVTGETHA